MKDDQARCNTCVLTESKTISIDSNGNCSVCNSEDELTHVYRKPDLKELEKKISEIKEKGKSSEYDCIVGWSGGRDSTSLLYELVHKHNLRCVAIFIKTPFTPEVIIENVRSIAVKLGIKLIESETPSNHIKIAAFCTKVYAKTKKPIMINLACASCKYLNLEVFKQAKKLKINYIIYGGNKYEYIPASAAEIKIKSKNRWSLTSMIKDNILRVFKGIGIFVRSPQLIKYIFIFFRASILYVNPYTVYFRMRYPRISLFDYYFLAEWDEERINFILKELDWKLPAGCVSTWKADCTFEAVKNTVFKKELGFTYSQAMYSNLVRVDKMSRSEAIERLEKEPISDQRLSEILQMFEIPEDKFIE